MNDWFGEKTPQVDPSTLNAFGIELSTRHSQANELTQMIRFAEACARRKVAHYVESVFYDSKACMCSFELAPTVKEGDVVANAILEAASETIAQYMWFDTVGHYDEELVG